ncbi:craniofacial development protein 1-like [Armigeres subalbatus]|uniref:craniofacial development protein 1-like n=1 Tax=Armigeres subalbatus TaxID=124917 RepID=UPI002ED3D136
MDPENYPSDSDASDEDFRPDKDDESASEVDSDESDVEDLDIKDDKAGDKKRKQKSKNAGNKKRKLTDAVGKESKDNNQTEKLQDEEDEERLTDALWADFLSGAGSSNGSTTSTSKMSICTKKELPPKTDIKHVSEKSVSNKSEKSATITKIFEFAGEAVEVTEDVSRSQTLKTASKPALGAFNGNAGTVKQLGARPSGGGLGAVLSQLGKKNKLSTLEKTKLDWNSFKRTQGIEEELQTHNKGKDGFLERQDFLQRADVRQFEIEKSFRQSSKSNR